ncbi:MAG: hypothetical protein H6Q59_1072 [Firmicutes bacterium]|nr:hypothetical protein [Bacillota bacterium]
MKSLDYDVQKQEVINILENSKTIVLATCSNNIYISTRIDRIRYRY